MSHWREACNGYRQDPPIDPALDILFAPSDLFINVRIEGRFVGKRVAPIKDRGVFRGNGTLAIADGFVRVTGRRIPSQNVRIALGFAWFVGLISIAAYAFTVAYPQGFAGQSGLSIPIIVFAYVAANNLHLVKDDLRFPISRISVLASDPLRILLAISITGHPNASPVVMRVKNSDTLSQALQELQSSDVDRSTWESGATRRQSDAPPTDRARYAFDASRK
jgi:hypothetical protein